MGWVYLDDQFPDHPKIVAAGPLAAWLYVAGLAYCKRYGTPGVIPKAHVPRLIAHRTVREQARKLVATGLWIETSSGYQVHDWDDWNRDATARSEAGRKAAQARWSRESRNANALPSHSESHSDRIDNAHANAMRKDAQSHPIPTTRYARGLTSDQNGQQQAARVAAERHMAELRAQQAIAIDPEANVTNLHDVRAALRHTDEGP